MLFKHGVYLADEERKAQSIAVGGGMMIRAKGVLLGGIAVSGAPSGDADDVCAKAGIAAINDALELE